MISRVFVNNGKDSFFFLVVEREGLFLQEVTIAGTYEMVNLKRLGLTSDPLCIGKSGAGYWVVVHQEGKLTLFTLDGAGNILNDTLLREKVCQAIAYYMTDDLFVVISTNNGCKFANIGIYNVSQTKLLWSGDVEHAIESLEGCYVQDEYLCVNYTTPLGVCASWLINLESRKTLDISFNEDSNEKCLAIVDDKYLVQSDIFVQNRFYFLDKNNVKEINIDYNPAIEYEFLSMLNGDKLLYIEKRTSGSCLNIVRFEKEYIVNPFTILEDVLVFSTLVIEGSLFIVGSSVSHKIFLCRFSLNSFVLNFIYTDDAEHIIETHKEINSTLPYKKHPDIILRSGQSSTKKDGVVVFLHGGPWISWSPMYSLTYDQIVDRYDFMYINYFGSGARRCIDYSRKENRFLNRDLNEVNDLKSSISAASTKILFGESYGAFLAWQAWQLDINYWDKLILFSPFYSFSSLMKSTSSEKLIRTLERCHVNDVLCRPYDSFDFFEVAESKPSSRTEVSIIHSPYDEIIPISESFRISNYLNESFEWLHSEPKLIALQVKTHQLQTYADKLNYQEVIHSILSL